MEQMLGVCNPRTEEELAECAELGKSLSRLSQPTILTLLAANDKPMHGYLIVQQAAKSPMFGGKKPDATGVYRALKRMEQAGLVTSRWDTPEEGSAKRLFTLTNKGRECLRRWVDALACYKLTIEELRVSASTALGIDVPPTPYCAHAASGIMGEMEVPQQEAEEAYEQPAEAYGQQPTAGAQPYNEQPAAGAYPTQAPRETGFYLG